MIVRIVLGKKLNINECFLPCVSQITLSHFTGIDGASIPAHYHCSHRNVSERMDGFPTVGKSAWERPCPRDSLCLLVADLNLLNRPPRMIDWPAELVFESARGRWCGGFGFVFFYIVIYQCTMNIFKLQCNSKDCLKARSRLQSQNAWVWFPAPTIYI